jgi:hypothetical protein
MNFIWNNLKIVEEDFYSLTKAIWNLIFQHSSNIYEPVEEAELRF